MNVGLECAIEIIVLLGYDGQLELKSSLETNLFKDAVVQDGSPYFHV